MSEVAVARLVLDFIEIREFGSLAELIDALRAAQLGLPSAAEAEVRLRGDDFFGHSLQIAYRRPPTQEEVRLHARYAQ